METFWNASQYFCVPVELGYVSQVSYTENLSVKTDRGRQMTAWDSDLFRHVFL